MAACVQGLQDLTSSTAMARNCSRWPGCWIVRGSADADDVRADDTNARGSCCYPVAAYS